MRFVVPPPRHDRLVRQQAPEQFEGALDEGEVESIHGVSGAAAINT
jgi:hypothetical protein